MNYCTKCPLNIFRVNTSPHYEGVGDPWKGRVIVVPTIDSKGWTFDKQIETIGEVLNLSTGELLQTLFVVPLIRCNEHLKCMIDSNAINKCRMWLNEDIAKYEFKDILLLGSAVNNILNCPIGSNLNYVCLHDKQRYFVNYSPYIKDRDAEKYEIFKANLIRWYNSTMTGMYDNYDIFVLS